MRELHSSYNCHYSNKSRCFFNALFFICGVLSKFFKETVGGRATTKEQIVNHNFRSSSRRGKS